MEPGADADTGGRFRMKLGDVEQRGRKGPGVEEWWGCGVRGGADT